MNMKISTAKGIDSSFIQRLYTSLDLSIATEDSRLN